MTHFEPLSNEEIQVLEDAIPQIAVLIAGADGEIDSHEIDWATKLAHIRTYSSSVDLREFYKQIDKTFVVKTTEIMKYSSTNKDVRQAKLSENLEKINSILAKLDHKTAEHLYESFISFAKGVANASGGVLGFHTLHSEEKKWVTLPMITPVLPS